MIHISDYEKDWLTFRKYIEDKSKNRCVINNKGWLKLRDFHFENFIVTVPQPYGLIFKMIYMSKVHKNIPCIYRVYNKYRKERVEGLVFQKNQDKAQAFRRYR